MASVSKSNSGYMIRFHGIPNLVTMLSVVKDHKVPPRYNCGFVIAFTYLLSNVPMRSGSLHLLNATEYILHNTAVSEDVAELRRSCNLNFLMGAQMFNPLAEVEEDRWMWRFVGCGCPQVAREKQPAIVVPFHTEDAPISPLLQMFHNSLTELDPLTTTGIFQHDGPTAQELASNQDYVRILDCRSGKSFHGSINREQLEQMLIQPRRLRSED